MSELKTTYATVVFRRQMGGREWECRSIGGARVGRVTWNEAIAAWVYGSVGCPWLTAEDLLHLRDFLLQLNRRGAPGGIDGRE